MWKQNTKEEACFTTAGGSWHKLKLKIHGCTVYFASLSIYTIGG